MDAGDFLKRRQHERAALQAGRFNFLLNLPPGDFRRQGAGLPVYVDFRLLRTTSTSKDRPNATVSAT